MSYRCAGRARWVRGRGRSRGYFYVEYLVVTSTIFFLLIAVLCRLGPQVVLRHRQMVNVIAKKGP